MNDLFRSLRLGFAGTPEFAVPALEALHASPHTLVAVFTQPDRPAGRGQSLHESAVKRRARALALQVHQPSSFRTPQVLELLQAMQLDALVVVAYGLILPAAVLRVPRLGCFNIHASLLPRWRGAAPIQRAVLAGDDVTGVTIMRMEAGLDTGPILRVAETAIAPTDTAGDLHDRLAVMGGRLMCETLDEVAAGRGHGTPQPTAGVTYADKLDKSEALIDWQDDARKILRKIRAFNPWPIAETRWAGVQLRIWNAELAPPEGSGSALGAGAAAVSPGTVVGASDAGIDVVCGSGVLRIHTLQLAGRKALPASEFIKSQRLLDSRFAAQ